MTITGRPPIGNLTALNLRIQTGNVAALDRIVKRERALRSDPAFNRTDAIREAITEYIARRENRVGP